MKKNLGSLLTTLVIVVLSTALSRADDFSYKFTPSTTTPYLKEAVTMKLDLIQTDHSKVMFFKFSPKKSDDYDFYRLNIKEEDAYHAAKVHYTYLIYPKRDGNISITFDLIKMITTDEKVAYSFSGDRDNIKGLNKKDIPIDLPPLKLQVKPLPKGTLIVGDFTLWHTIKKKEAKSFEALPFTVTIKGGGYPPILTNIIPDNKNFTLFKETPIANSTRSISGTKGSVTYPMALSAKQSFDLPAITLKAFNPKTEKSYNLAIPKEHFTITQPDQSTLLDKIDSPEPLQSNWSWLGTLLGYLIVFAAGFLTAKSFKWSLGTKQQAGEDAITKEIQAINDPKELLALLIAADARRYKNTIEKLEESLYGKRKHSLKNIKKGILQTISEENL
ncbi:MAG: hypothetical protein U9R26_07555 [Campylobacterota bacterium]|nr:hypothetical protein [Campylobacterota bacterium]